VDGTVLAASILLLVVFDVATIASGPAEIIARKKAAEHGKCILLIDSAEHRERKIYILLQAFRDL
jgi:hypothetical protein